MTKQAVSFTTLPHRIVSVLPRLRPYRFIAFIVFLGILYGFVLVRIGSLSSAEPSVQAVDSQVKAARIPHINENVVKQLESLEDNSVSVQALFNQARNNPFE